MNKNVNKQLVELARAGKFDQIKLLVDQHKADINYNRCSYTPLCAAAFEGHTEIVEYLVNMGADINKTSRKDQFTALACAVQQDRLDTAKKLVELGAKTDITVGGWIEPRDLWALAVEACDEDMYRYILDDVLKIEDNESLKDDPRPSRALRRAASLNDRHTVDWLISESGADMESTAPDGSNAIILAILHGSHRVVENLIMDGAKLNVKYEGMNLMDLAISTDWPWTINVLAEYGVTTTKVAAKRYAKSADIRNMAGHGLHYATRWLLYYGANVDRGIEDNKTALVVVCEYGYDFEMAKILIESGARTDIPIKGKKLSDFAKERFGEPMIQLLSRIDVLNCQPQNS